jgi:hypothetical protein
MKSISCSLSQANAARIRELHIEQHAHHLHGKSFPRLTALHFVDSGISAQHAVSLEPAAASTATSVTHHMEPTRPAQRGLTVFRISSSLAALTCPLHEGLLTCLATPEQPLRRLRMLHLYRHHARNPQRTAQLLGRLCGGGGAEPGLACPALEDVRFYNIFRGNPPFFSDRAAAGRAFDHFAHRPALKALSITHFAIHQVTPVPARAEHSVADADGGGAGNVAAAAAAAAAATTSSVKQLQLWAPLTALEISIEAASMRQVARVFPALTHLAVAVTKPDEVMLTAMPPDVFAALGTLTALRCLDLRLSYATSVTAADMRALQRLEQLRHLTLHSCCSAPDLAPADVLQLLRGLRHAQTLQLHLDWSPPPETLSVLGAACPQLRHADMWGDFHLVPALGLPEQQARPPGHQLSPLFGNLEDLHVLKFCCIRDKDEMTK